MHVYIDDWRSDQYRWINQGVRSLPKKDPTMRKSYFQLHTPDGPSKEFTRHAYELIPYNGTTLIHYVGNEKAVVAFPHGNVKKNPERDYVRTCPSTLRNLEMACSSSTASKVYKAAVTKSSLPTHLSVLQPRNDKQIENLQIKQLQQKRISHDSLYNLHELAFDVPNFIHSIRTFPDLVCIFGQKEILEEFDKVLVLTTTSPQLLSYDTTFKLGDFYMSVLCFRHVLFKESPVIPAAFLLHERKFEEYHKEFLSICKKMVQSLKSATCPLVTDEERGIVNAVAEVFPQIPQLRCWNHIIRDVKAWLRKHGASSEEVSVYVADIQNMFHLPTEKQYTDSLQEMEKRWSAPFFDYYKLHIHPDIHSVSRWATEPYRVYDRITNNQSESLNFTIKQLQEWRESPIDSMVLAMYYLQMYYKVEIMRGKNNLGKYHLHSQYSNITVSQCIPVCNAYTPEEIVQRIRGDLQVSDTKSLELASATDDCDFQYPKHLTQKERARKVIELEKITFDPSFHTFTVVGTDRETPNLVKLFPKQTCSCPSTSECYHIIAAKLSIGLESQSEKKINLTQLRKNIRSRKEKRSGRKRPRPGDCDITPAPDSKNQDIPDEEYKDEVDVSSVNLASVPKEVSYNN